MCSLFRKTKRKQNKTTKQAKNQTKNYLVQCCTVARFIQSAQIFGEVYKRFIKALTSIPIAIWFSEYDCSRMRIMGRLSLRYNLYLQIFEQSNELCLAWYILKMLQKFPLFHGILVISCQFSLIVRHYRKEE